MQSQGRDRKNDAGFAQTHIGKNFGTAGAEPSWVPFELHGEHDGRRDRPSCLNVTRDSGGSIRVGVNGCIYGDDTVRTSKTVGVIVGPTTEEPVIYGNEGKNNRLTLIMNDVPNE